MKSTMTSLGSQSFLCDSTPVHSFKYESSHNVELYAHVFRNLGRFKYCEFSVFSGSSVVSTRLLDFPSSCRQETSFALR